VQPGVVNARAKGRLVRQPDLSSQKSVYRAYRKTPAAVDHLSGHELPEVTAPCARKWGRHPLPERASPVSDSTSRSSCSRFGQIPAVETRTGHFIDLPTRLRHAANWTLHRRRRRSSRAPDHVRQLLEASASGIELVHLPAYPPDITRRPRSHATLGAPSVKCSLPAVTPNAPHDQCHAFAQHPHPTAPFVLTHSVYTLTSAHLHLTSGLLTRHRGSLTTLHVIGFHAVARHSFPARSQPYRVELVTHRARCTFSSAAIYFPEAWAIFPPHRGLPHEDNGVIARIPWAYVSGYIDGSNRCTSVENTFAAATPGNLTSAGNLGAPGGIPLK